LTPSQSAQISERSISATGTTSAANVGDFPNRRYVPSGAAVSATPWRLA